MREEPIEIQKPGLRYETCVSCGKIWNVSIYAPQGWYICPGCRRGGEKRERK